MPMKELVEKRKELETKQAVLAKVFEDGGADTDMSKVLKIGAEDVNQWTTTQKAEKIKTLNDELTALGEEVDRLVAVEDAGRNVKAIKGRMIHPAANAEEGSSGKSEPEIKSIGQAIAAKHGKENWELFKSGKISIDIPDILPSDIFRPMSAGPWMKQFFKTLLETGAGWAPESVRLPGFVEAVSRPIQIIDIIPSARTGQAAIVYMEETTRTHSAAEKAEGAAYAESTFALTERTSTVRKITDSLPVTDEQLEDVPAVESYINNRLTFGVRQRLDGQLLTGDGSAPNLRGVLNVSGIQTQAKGADPTPDAVYKAIVKIRVTGRAQPNACIFHPNDWQDIRLLRTSDGIYIWGSPSEAGPMRIWGINVIESDAETENTGLVGDFANFCSMFERAGVVVEVGYVADNFKEGKRTIRAQMRVAFVVFRATAFCTVTGI